MDDPIANAFMEESRHQAENARKRIAHCLDQLQDEDLWWVPGPGCNSIGIIVQHLLGNLRQWILSGAGGDKDIRDRPAEFRVDEKTSKSALQERLDQILDHILAVYDQQEAPDLLEKRRIQGYDSTVLQAVYGTMTHFDLHAGQIVYATRLRLGQTYKKWWKPTTKEQGI